ncbi:MAG: patatin-like phospholipase family protein [Prochlorococcaceae cyanobacterium]
MAFKILCFDGGGYRGRLTALMLVELQKAIDSVCAQKQIPSKSILDCFDLIAGTSTGSLIAAALSIGRSADDVLDIFRSDGAAIFPAQSLIDLIFKAASVPLFDGSELENMLQKHLGQMRLGEIKKALLITAYDSWNNRPVAFRSYDPACNGIRLFDACRGSSAYPAGFPSHVLKDDQETNPYFQSLRAKRSYFSFDHSCEGRDGIPLIDGGIGANNPAALALAESIGSLSATAQETLLVSFGTGQMPPSINYEKGRGFSVKDWNGQLGNPLLEMMFVGYSRISDELCRTMIGEQNYFRFQPILLPEAVDSVLISKNNVVRINAAEGKAFAGATFQATHEINKLFDRVCDSYFYENDYTIDPDSPEKQLHLLAHQIA